MAASHFWKILVSGIIRGMSATADSSLTSINSAPHLRPRRLVNRLALALVGVGVAAAGQYFFSQESLWDGLLFYLVAAILFVRALAPQLPISTQPEDHIQNFSLDALSLRTGWWRYIGVWLIILAVAISLIAFSAFGQNDTLRQGWWLYGISLVLLVGGMIMLTRGNWRDDLRHLWPNRYAGLSLLMAIVALAVFMRLYHFYSQPFGIWFDEAEAGLQARRILQEPTYRPILYAPINITGHLLAIYAVALKWLGDNIYALRSVSVAFGLGGVLAAYLFGAQLRGWRFGLLLAFLVAVARWHVNFSRIAMTGVDTPFFEFLSLFFLTRLLQHGRLRDAFWAGLTLGGGLVFYTAFRLYGLALAATVLVLIPVWRRWLLGILQKGGWAAQLMRLAALVIAVWLIVMPLVKFALDNPEAFWYRTEQISIFTKRDQADVWQALSHTTAQHLLMFNYEGDKNGRHNLPGAPMLDPAMAVFFVLGIGLALLRLRQPANAFFLLLIPIGLAGGIFSVDFEAPQSLRSMAVFPAVIYFCGLALATLGREAEQALKPLPRLWRYGPGLALAVFILFSNSYVYFVRQANNFASWNAFSTPETIVGQKMAELGPDYSYYMSPFLAAHPTLNFLAPNALDRHPITLPDALPIRRPADRPVVLFIHPDDEWVFEQARQFYPNAKFYSVTGHDEEGEGPPVVYIVELQPADIAGIQGLEVRYWPGRIDDLLAGESRPAPLQMGRALTVSATWPGDSPTADNFVAEWSGVLYVPQYGLYNLRLVTPGPAQLEINGYEAFNSLTGTSNQSEHVQVKAIILPQGNHSLRLRAAAGVGQVGLYWQPPGQPETLIPQWALYTPPVTNHGLLGTFYANADWQGPPTLQRIDPFLDTYFHFIPMNRPYTVEWTGWLDVPQSGFYRLGLRAVTEAQVFLDGRLIVATEAPDKYTEAPPLTLTQGLHDLRVRYKDSADRSRIHLIWTPPNGQTEPIPSTNLWPPLGHEPERPAPPPLKIEVKPLRLEWLTSLGGPGTFLEPRDVAVQTNGRLIVADTGQRWVQILDGQGNFIQGLTGDPFPFEEPVAVGVNSKDEILVLDSTLQWIYRYDPAGNFIDRFGGPTAYFFHPRGLTVFADDTLGVADTGSARIALFSPDDNLVGSFGQLGSGPGQFSEPTDVLRDEQNAYFVVEAMNSRIQRLDSGGVPLNQWAIPPSYAYNGPHLAFGPDGSIFVTESQSQALLRYSPDGALLNQWQTIGPVTLAMPVGIYFDPTSGRLYVTDVEMHQVHVFAVKN